MQVTDFKRLVTDIFTDIEAKMTELEIEELKKDRCDKIKGGKIRVRLFEIA